MSIPESQKRAWLAAAVVATACVLAGTALFFALQRCVKEPATTAGHLVNVLNEYQHRFSGLAVAHLPRSAFREEVQWLRAGCLSRWYVSIFGEVDPEEIREWGSRDAEDYSEGSAAVSRVYRTDDGQTHVVWDKGDQVVRLSGSKESLHYTLTVSAATGRFELSFGPHW